MYNIAKKSNENNHVRNISHGTVNTKIAENSERIYTFLTVSPCNNIVLSGKVHVLVFYTLLDLHVFPLFEIQSNPVITTSVYATSRLYRQISW